MPAPMMPELFRPEYRLLLECHVRSGRHNSAGPKDCTAMQVYIVFDGWTMAWLVACFALTA